MRIYRWLLRYAAPQLDREYGDAMEDALDARLADARALGAIAYTRTWVREVAALAGVAISDRVDPVARERRRRRRAHSRGKATLMGTLIQDVRHAARRLAHSPAFTSASILTLALAVGANTAIFAVVERIVINPLPYPDSDRLFELDHGSAALRMTAGMGTTQGLYYHYQERARAIESMALYRTSDQTLTGDGNPERIRVTRATPSLSTVMRVPPAVGRWFSEDEGRPGAADVAVLSHALWTRRYGRDPNVVGQSITLGGRPLEVIGVMPPAFSFPEPRVDVWAPSQLSRATGFGLWEHAGVARLREGWSYDAGRSELQALIPGVVQAFPDDPLAAGNVQSTQLIFAGRLLKDATLGAVSRALWILLGSVGIVLLVACANVANLFLVRAEVRQREVAIRRTLGAGGAALGRYFLSESVVLSTAGGALGLVLAWGGLRLLVRLGPTTLPRLHEVHLDAVGVAYGALLSLAAAILFGTIPLWRSRALTPSLHEQGRASTTARPRHRARHLLLGAQVALALVLLVASGLMLRSFHNLRAVDPGFDEASALTFSIGLPDNKYSTLDGAVTAHQALIDRLSALPGVRAVSGTTCLPLSGGCTGNTVRVEGVVYPEGEIPPLAMFRAVTGGYFETMGVRVLRGRSITRDDVDRQAPVAVISDALAKRAFPNEDPIGRRMASNQPPRPGLETRFTWLEVVGVVANTPVRAVNEPRPMPYLYTPLSIARGPDVPMSAMIAPSASVLSFVLRSNVPPLDLVPAARQAVYAFDEDLALAQIITLEEMLNRASAQMAFTMVLLVIAAVVALVLGVIGISGVMFYIVSQRTSEIGVRLALGAEPRLVAGHILWQGGLVAIGGIVVGLCGAFASSGLIGAVLYGVSPRDPVVFGGTALLLLVVALLACWLPARRAARLSPLVALRTE